MTDRAELERLREELRQAAIDADRDAQEAVRMGPDFRSAWHHHTGRCDAFALALVLVDNLLDGGVSGA